MGRNVWIVILLLSSCQSRNYCFQIAKNGSIQQFFCFKNKQDFNNWIKNN